MSSELKTLKDCNQHLKSDTLFYWEPVQLFQAPAGMTVFHILAYQLIIISIPIFDTLELKKVNFVETKKQCIAIVNPRKNQSIYNKVAGVIRIREILRSWYASLEHRFELTYSLENKYNAQILLLDGEMQLSPTRTQGHSRYYAMDVWSYSNKELRLVII